MSKASHKQSGPKRVRHGVKLRGKHAPEADHPLARKWLDAIDAAFDDDAKADGLEYAQLGQVISLEVERGEVTAAVQGRAAKPYQTTLALSHYDPAAWERAIHSMADEAVYAANLLAREVPADVESLFQSLDLSLLPVEGDPLRVTCTCRGGGFCKHGAAVGWLLAERIAAEPMILFTLRGMPAERLLERLQQVRAMHTHGVAAAHPDPHMPGSQKQAPPLESMLDSYWRCGRNLSEIVDQPPAAHVPHALLRRLGPSPMQGRFPMVGLLASIYDAVSVEAMRLRDGDTYNSTAGRNDTAASSEGVIVAPEPGGT